MCIFYLLHRLSKPLQRTTILCLLFSVSWNIGWAKEVPVTGVFLYNGANGPSYVQITGLSINGKTELRACGGPGPIDRSAYKNLPKLNLASLQSLERLPDGTLQAQSPNSQPRCVVPSNFKFDKETSLSPADIIDQSVFSGTVVGSMPEGVHLLPAFSRGAEFVLGSASDTELAEYLRATRAASLTLLRSYLTAFPNAPHSAQAHDQAAGLLNTDGQAKLAAYRASSQSTPPNFAQLKLAREDEQQALENVPGNTLSLKLADEIQAELALLDTQAVASLDVYQKALAAHTAGYGRLLEAQKLSSAITMVDPSFAPGISLAKQVAAQSTAHDAALQRAQAHLKSQNVDAAVTDIAPYRSFADEDPGVKDIVEQAYKIHLAKGVADQEQSKWKEASLELNAAYMIRPTPEAKAKLALVEAGLNRSQSEAAVQRALTSSQEDVAANDPIQAYEVLDDLPEAQRALVKEQLTALEPAYTTAALARARQLQQMHTPIHGRADEDAVRQAYDYYTRLSTLSSDEEIKIKMELLSQIISSYYVDLGRKYMERPLSSGVGVGWLYMTEAQQYRKNLDQVRDEMTRNAAAYQIRSKLSIAVLFRDQTSRRNSAGFADQMQQAFATGIETSGLPVKVILPGSGNTLEPNFQFVGEILQHQPTRTVRKETLPSEYRSGSREIPNDAWNKADLEFEGHTMDLQKAQAALAASKNKKQIELANEAIAAQQKKVQEARAIMNSTPKTLSEPILSPYNYTQTTLEVTSIVELSFRIIDSLGNIIQGPIRVIKGAEPRKFILLENIKPDDTRGVKEVDSPPDENQLMNDVEIQARDSMVKTAREKVLELPVFVLARARSRVTGGDVDGAAELYILYLNSTPQGSTPERSEASQFLAENFNLRHTSTLSASLP